MHLSEGVLEWPVLVASAALAGAGVVWGLRSLPATRLSQAAVLVAVFFVGGTIHIPLGVGSVHLVLSGLLGLLLGWAVFPVLLVGLILQAVLLSFGGLTVLGANLLVLGLPAALMGGLLRPALARCLSLNPDGRLRLTAEVTTRNDVLRRVSWLGVTGGAASLAGSVALAALLLWLSGGQSFIPLILLISLAHVPALIMDSVITALTITSLLRFSPEILRSLVQPTDTD